jgi:hypothetical protein
MKKIIVRLAVFLSIFILLLTISSNILVRKGNGYGTDVYSFYHEKKDSLNLIFFGSSHSYATFSPNVLEEELGLKAYNFSTQQQPLWITYYYMKETLKYQHPDFWVLEILMTAYPDDYMDEGVNRDAIDKMKFSFNKISAINNSVENNNDRLSYYFNIIKYHSRWNELTKWDLYCLLSSNISSTHGFTYLKNSVGIAEYRDMTSVTERKDLTPKNNEYLLKIIELAKKNNIQLIFVKSPCTMLKEKQKVYNTICDIAEKNNIGYWNCNLMNEKLNLNYRTDFYDSGHVLGSTAIKITTNFANYLKNNFKI